MSSPPSHFDPPDTDDGEWNEFDVPEASDGARLDQTLASLVPAIGRKLAGQLCEQKKVLVDGRPSKKSTSVHAGQKILLKTESWGEALPAPHIPLRIRLERDDLVIVEKPAGLPTAALAFKEGDTLAGALLAHFPEMKGVGYSLREPGVLHRLDHYTSGLLVAAKNQVAFSALRESLDAGRWTKKYLALLVPGVVQETGTISGTLSPDPRHKRRVRVGSPDGPGRPSRTEYRRIRASRSADLVEVTVDRAYRHQIRTHFASIGAPLLGDELYGGPKTALSPRHALHASYIACAMGDDSFEVESPLPEELERLLDD